MQHGLFPDVEKAALLSPCGLYRYTLRRAWDEGGRVVNFVMLNPSTADAEEDDATIRRCVGYARSWGFGSLLVTNLFAFRSTDPAGLLKAADPVGPDNDRHVRAAAAAAGLVVCAWGAHPLAPPRARDVTRMLLLEGREPHAISLTRSGQPAHPLRLPARYAPFPFLDRKEGPAS
jgi:hypothetical protein